MPIYEYQCSKCGVFEVTQRITESPLKKCPTCKGKVERIISATSFVLKGSGWYATDYAKSKSSTEPKTSSDTSGSSATPSSTSESKGNGAAASSSETSSKSSETTSKSTTSEKPAA